MGVHAAFGFKSSYLVQQPTPVTIKETYDTSLYMRTFCLCCKKVDIVAKENYAHGDCPGPVVVVRERFDTSSALSMQQALVKVNKTIDKLKAEEVYLKEVRKKYEETKESQTNEEK
jgi:hypothetical protein